MSLFSGPEQHAANPPESWSVTKRAERVWSVTTAMGTVLETFTTKRAAEEALRDGWAVKLYDKDRRWYAGENIPGWRPYADCVARP